MPTSGTEVVIDDVSDARVSGLSMAERADLLRTGKCRTGTDVTMKIADAKAAEIRNPGVAPPGRLLGTPQNDQKSVLHTYRGL